MQHVDPDRLPLLALDDDFAAADDERAHLAECPTCLAEYRAFRDVIELGKEAGPDDLQPPPPPLRVWQAIEAETRVERRTTTTTAPRRLRYLLLAAVACVLGVVLGAGAALGWQALRPSKSPAEMVAASSGLEPVGNGGGTGDARLLRDGDRYTLEIDVRDLPLTNGFYEAWMFVPGTTRMQAMGAVRPGEVARFPLPSGLDPAGWRGIDISAEAFDGDPGHSATSVLRGELRR